jgi:hypothetical protein
MQQSLHWRAKAAEYAIKAQTIADASLRQQYAELACRYLEIAAKLDDTSITLAPETHS